jgi:PKD repeat protein
VASKPLRKSKVTGRLFIAQLATVVALAQSIPSGAQTAHFTASPRSGPAPLTVTFCASAGITIDFGDGTCSGMGTPPSGACAAGDTYVTHTYVAPGTYQLRGFPCPGVNAAACGSVAEQASAIHIVVGPPN